MKENYSNNTVWLDLLCWESVVKILLVDKVQPKVIYYCQVSALILPFLSVLRNITETNFVHVVDFVAGEERIGSASAFETIHIRLKKILNKVSNRWIQHGQVQGFAAKNNFNIVKIKEHLKEAAFFFVYRPVEMSVISEIRYKERDGIYYFRKTPFSKVLSEELVLNSVHYYATIFSHHFKVLKREENIFDNMIAGTYYQDRFESLGRVLLPWLLNVTKAFIGRRLFRANYLFSRKVGVNIGIEFLQKKLRLGVMSDFFWLDQSHINPENVYSIESFNVDAKSEKILSSLGVYRARSIGITKLLKLVFSTRSGIKNVIYFVPDMTFFKRTLYGLLTLLVTCIKWNELAWLNYQLTRYSNQSYFWSSIYSQLNIRVLSSIIDSDNNKLAKAQALEMVGGIYAGSHWSNFPLGLAFNQKCYDVLFTWGTHFVKNILDPYPSLATFNVGYPSDHYFRKQDKQAQILSGKYPGKFILTYMDNVMANDIHYSRNMQLNIHKMLIDILDKNDHVILFLKPKKEYCYDIIAKEIPMIKELIKNNRIVTFLGDEESIKAVPAMVGMASDLVVGLGISTTAAECQFAGTLSFHADLTGFRNNEFGNRGLGKIVFRDVDSLKDAIIDVIDNGASKKYLEYKELYSTLDPFQDGQAYKRMGFVMKSLQELLTQGRSREETIAIAKKKYDEFIKRTYKEKILC